MHIKRSLALLWTLVIGGAPLLARTEPDADFELRIDRSHSPAVTLSVGGEVLVTSPPEGLWSVATAFEDDWPAQWIHAHPTMSLTAGGLTDLTGWIQLEEGKLGLRDTYRREGNRVRVVRRFTWHGPGVLERAVLAVRWSVPGAQDPAPLLPGISLYGNPSGARHPERVPLHAGVPGMPSLYEEHRYPMPFACLEWTQGEGRFGAALHTLPSAPLGARHADQWWSLGWETVDEGAELLVWSGPCATNGRRNVVKAQQRVLMDYPAPWVTLRPGTVIEKTFWLQAFPLSAPGTSAAVPVETSLELHRPFGLDGLPSYQAILEQKREFAESRFRDGREHVGFEMYPPHLPGAHYVMGWCGQAAAAGYAFLALAERFGDDSMRDKGARSLDVLSTAPVSEEGFPVRFDAEANIWSAPDHVSQGQAMESFSLAVELARGRGDLDGSKWESFLKRAADAHATRILRADWRPVSTSEAFLVSPLLRSARLFGEERFRRAALKAVEHYAARHLGIEEPYWGGTLDASCEDKEGAWAAWQAFLAAYEDTGDPRHLDWAEHAMNQFLTYVVVWDIEMPPGRLRDHGFRSHGWTAVSPQNEHLDVYGVVATPDLWRMGTHLDRPEWQRLAAVMYRSCGQLIDLFGSQGEQIQQTNYAQHGDLSDVFRLRGAYSEGWTVFWITAHFLHAAARFEAMGIDLDAEPGFRASHVEAVDPVTFESLLGEMVDRATLARRPEPAYACRQFSSTSRASTEVCPEDGEFHPEQGRDWGAGWFENHDFANFLRTEEIEGRVEHVMMDHSGPGAIVRMWNALGGRGWDPGGILRIYLDGKVVIEGKVHDVVGGDALVDEPFSYLASDDDTRPGWRGRNLYLPLPYAESCKVTYEELAPDSTAWNGFYYQINYRAYAPGTKVETISLDTLAAAAPRLQRIGARLVGTALLALPEGAEEQTLPPFPLPPGEARTIERNGGGMIGKLALGLEADDPEQALRSTVLEISFDGQSTVFCPLGAFFGVGTSPVSHRTFHLERDESGTMTAWWPMPFASHATISIRNLGEQSVTVRDLSLRTEPWTWDERSLHFHATWFELRRQATRTRQDVNYVTVRGEGVYVGDSLTIFNTHPDWWGEGDEKIFVDGEPFPSHFGTGTEDYYGYAWCRPQPFSRPHHSQPIGAGNKTVGTSTNNRVRTLDAIPFTTSIQVDMELWHPFDAPVNYAPATFFYARPGAEVSVRPDPKAAARSVARRREDVAD